MPLPAQSFGRQLEELVAHFVVPGESILWWSRPSFLLRASVPLQWSLAVVILTLLFAFTTVSSEFDQTASLWTGIGYAVLFIVVGFLVFVLENWKRQRYTLYLNTSHRAIAFEATSPTNFLILECWPEDLPTLRAKWDRVEWVDGRDPHRVRRKGQFLGIWHAHKVRGLIQETLRSRLHERFQSGDPAVRRAAIISAAESSGPDWMPLELLQAAESCDDPLVRLVATQALMRLRQTTAEASPEPAGDLLSK